MITAASHITPCYGVMCPVHADCERYRLVDGMSGRVDVLATCLIYSGERPLFIPATAALELP